MTTHRILLISDLHFYNPHYYEGIMGSGAANRPPSRLSTELALGDRANPFHGLIQLARSGAVNADTLVCAGDLTTCADPSAMNLGWLQLHRLASELGAGEPVMTAGNHDIDSRFQTSVTSPQRMLNFLDPPFPVSDAGARASYWANGYCILDRESARFVLINSCALHGYATENDRHLDHGYVPDLAIELLEADLASREDVSNNVVVFHHHPIEIDLPPEDSSLMSNGREFLDLLGRVTPPGWLVLHGHRHLPSVQYANGSVNAPVVFSAGSFSADLHLRLQGRTANQFYEIELHGEHANSRGTFLTWTWDQHAGEWRRGEETRAMPSTGGFGYRDDPHTIAMRIEPLIPEHADGPVTWRHLEEQISELRYLLPEARAEVLDRLSTLGVDCGDSDLTSPPDHLRLGRSK